MSLPGFPLEPPLARATAAVAAHVETIEAPVWDLGDLYQDRDDPRIEADLVATASQADELAATFKGRLVDLTGDELAGLLERYEALDEQIDRVASFAQLLFAANRDDPAIGRFYQTVQERINAIGTVLLFVTLEINRIEDSALAAKLDGSARLARLRPWLEQVRSFRTHQLDDEIERVLHEKHVTGRAAWVRLFDETMAALRFPVGDRELTSAEAFDLLSSKDRGLRETAATAIGSVLERNVRLSARIMNTVVKDKAIEDGWRRFARPISSRNLANQVEDEVVGALITAVRSAYPRLSHRYYTLKAQWMGLERLQYWDRNAPLPEDADQRRSWSDARLIVLDAYRTFSPKLAEIVSRFFDHNWIDAQARPGKDSGAFCHPTVPAVHPFVLMNFQGRNRDVMTLAHELGHGVHQTLAGRHGPLLASTPLTLAETASVFGEQLTFRALLAQADEPGRRRTLLAAKIEDMLNTVVRQIAFCDFESRVHDARATAELIPEDLARIWLEVQRESLGPAFEFRDDYRFYWSYIPHFLHVPFYVYAYAFGDCLVNSLYAVYEQQPEGFAPLYLELLAAGGTRRHKDLLAPFGLDAADPAFWDKGLAMLSGFIDELETTLEPRS